MQFDFQNSEENTNFFNRKQTLKQKLSSLLGEKKMVIIIMNFLKKLEGKIIKKNEE